MRLPSAVLSARTLAVCVLALAACATPRSAQAADMSLTFTIDRSGLPPLPYYDLTLKVDALGATSADVKADGVVVPSRLVGGKVVFTTSGGSVVVNLRSVTAPSRAGAFEKAVLKDDRAWAWSHGFDDNTNLTPGVEAFRARGWRGTLFMICQSIDDVRDESWIADAPTLKRLLAAGWSVGNHTWDHANVGSVATARASVVRCADRLAGIVAGSTRPAYKSIAFAAPNFDANYAPIIRELRDSHTTNLQFDESGNDFAIRVDPGATSAPAGAVPFSKNLVIGRYTPIGWDAPATIAQIETLAAQVNATNHLWFNSLAHGSNEASVTPVIAHVYTKYGPGGTNQVLVAPSDEIYSYILVRDGAIVTYGGSGTVPAVPAPKGPDFNGDGQADLLWQNQKTRELYAWLMNGTTATSGAYLTPRSYSGASWQVRGLADLNGDGRTDVLWHNETTGELYYWALNGMAATSAGYLSPARLADVNWQVRAAGDLNGDGKADLLWQNRTTGQLQAWLMNGATRASTVALSPSAMTDARWQIAGLADLNGDGKADLLWRHKGTGALSAWLMNGTTSTATVSLTPSVGPGLVWQIRGLSDLNGDGKADLLWHNQKTGDLLAWLMNGTVKASGVALTPARYAGSGWQVVPLPPERSSQAVVSLR